MKLSWNISVKKRLAVVLYVVGAICVLFVAYQAREHPGSQIGYIPIYVIGMVLVVIGIILRLKPEGIGEEQEGSSGTSGGEEQEDSEVTSGSEQ